ncbi:MAG: hypothetical protein ACI8P3_001238 [Saprospiraceae bacterium]|jgi:hypothetical protein
MIVNNNLNLNQLKLFKLLQILTKEEFFRLGKFLRSPFFNYTPTLVSFYKALKRYHPMFDSPRLQAEKLWLRVFPDKVYTEQKFRQLCSDLTRLAEKYFVQLELEQPEGKSQQLLIQSLGRRNAYDLLEKAAKARMGVLEQAAVQDAGWHQERCTLLEQWYFHPLHDKAAKKEDLLIELMDSLDAYFLLQKMKVGIALISKHKILKKDYDIRYLSILEGEEKDSFLEKNSLFQLYQASFDLLRNGEERDFLKIEDLLFDYLEDLKKEDLQLFFFNALNYAVRKMNRGEYRFGKEVLRWYKKGLEEGILIQDGLISVSTFQNIIHTSCKYGDFDFGKKFIETYQHCLAENLRKDTVAYGWGLFYFYKKELNKAISILMDENWEKSHQLSGRNLLVKAYFEKFLLDRNQYFFLENAIHAFEIFLMRNKEFPKAHLEPHLNLVRILKALARKIVAFESKKEVQSWLASQLEKRKKVISKSWLNGLEF